MYPIFVAIVTTQEYIFHEKQLNILKWNYPRNNMMQ
jgi:hypothetical protein